MMKNTFLNLGTTYFTDNGITVVPIKMLPGSKAIFVTSEFVPTPFVVWSYSLPDPTNPTLISLYSGTYYTTLEDALNGESDSSKAIELEVSFYCPDCETLHKYKFSWNGTVENLIENIEETRVVCTNCEYMWMGVHSIRVIGEHTDYTIPLWHGPVTNDGVVELDD